MATPCTTLRPETEWVETLDSGWNQLCFERLADLSEVALRPIPTSDRPPIFGRVMRPSVWPWLSNLDFLADYLPASHLVGRNGFR